jgi:transcriptional regulator with XRE-family HTH domain
MSANTNIRFRDWFRERMVDSEFRAEWEASEPAYQVTRLRIMRGLTQEQLAELVGTKQSSISRLESGQTEPRLSFLRRVVEALGGRLEVRVIPQEEAPMAEQPPVVVAAPSDSTGPIPVRNWPLPVDRNIVDQAADTVDAPSLERVGK